MVVAVAERFVLVVVAERFVLVAVAESFVPVIVKVEFGKRRCGKCYRLFILNSRTRNRDGGRVSVCVAPGD